MKEGRKEGKRGAREAERAKESHIETTANMKNIVEESVRFLLNYCITPSFNPSRYLTKTHVPPPGSPSVNIGSICPLFLLYISLLVILESTPALQAKQIGRKLLRCRTLSGRELFGRLLVCSKHEQRPSLMLMELWTFPFRLSIFKGQSPFSLCSRELKFIDDLNLSNDPSLPEHLQHLGRVRPLNLKQTFELAVTVKPLNLSKMPCAELSSKQVPVVFACSAISQRVELVVPVSVWPKQHWSWRTTTSQLSSPLLQRPRSPLSAH